MAISVSGLVPLFKSELELCKLRPGESVGIYSEGGARGSYAEAFARAAELLGASAFHIDLPVAGKNLGSVIGGRNVGRGLSGSPATVSALEQCDLMIDLVLLLYEPELEEIKAAGTRVLSCVEPPDVLARLLPTPDQRRRSEEELRLLQNAKRLRFTSSAGTDVTYEFGGMTPFCQYGYTDQPGRWDHFPSTLAVHCAEEVNGRVVLKPDDVILPFGRYVTSPVELTIANGTIESIDAGADALLIRDLMEQFDERAYAVSHIGWGLNERARWDALIQNPASIGMDHRAYEGSVMFSTGPNTEFGGTNDTPCHLDMPMRDCTLWLDDELIVDEGRIVKPSLVRHELAAAL
jgi:2,5-dihydroxypyridine 5,6-dioxygenase